LKNLLTFRTTMLYYLGSTKGDLFLEFEKKRGRPSSNPKLRKVQAKLDEETDAILVAYCDEKQVTESEAIRTGIRKLNDDLGDNER